MYNLTLRYGHPACAVKAQLTYGAIERRRERLTLYSLQRRKALYPYRDIEVGWRSSLSRHTAREVVATDRKKAIEAGWRSSLCRQTAGEVVATDRKKTIEAGWRNSLSRQTAREVVATDVEKL